MNQIFALDTRTVTTIFRLMSVSMVFSCGSLGSSISFTDFGIPSGTTDSTASASKTAAMPVIASTFDIQPCFFANCTFVSGNPDAIADNEPGAFLFTSGTWFSLAGELMTLSCRESEEGDLINDPTNSVFFSWLTVTSIGPVMAVCEPFQRNSTECTVCGPLAPTTTSGATAVLEDVSPSPTPSAQVGSVMPDFGPSALFAIGLLGLGVGRLVKRRNAAAGADGWRQPTVADHKTPADTTPGADVCAT